MWDELAILARAELLTILLTTHYLEEADALADRLAIVSRGRVVVEGTAEELKRGLQGDAVDRRAGRRRGERRQAVVRSLAGVHEVTRDGRVLRAASPRRPRGPDDPGGARPGRHPRRVRHDRRPSLDDVYLHYTGRDFRAEDEAGGAGPEEGE